MTCDCLKNLYNQLLTDAFPAISSQQKWLYPLDLELVNGRAPEGLISVQLLFCHKFHDDSDRDKQALKQAATYTWHSTASFRVKLGDLIRAAARTYCVPLLFAWQRLQAGP